MRKMTESESIKLRKEYCWGTLCTVSKDNFPYAIEFSYFVKNEKIYAIINPRGETAQNLANNANVCFKICDTDKKNMKYRSISCFGTAKYAPPETQEDIIQAWKDLAVALGRKETGFKFAWERFTPAGKQLPLLEKSINKITGVTNHGQKGD